MRKKREPLDLRAANAELASSSPKMSAGAGEPSLSLGPGGVWEVGARIGAAVNGGNSSFFGSGGLGTAG